MTSILPNPAPLAALLSAPLFAAEFLLCAAMAALAAVIIRADLRDMEIHAGPVLALAACGPALGLLAPVAGLDTVDVVLGALCGLLLGLAARAYAWLRTGLNGFGGADILLLAGAGGNLGPMGLGAVTALAAVAAIVLMVAMPRLFAPRTHPDMPACSQTSGADSSSIRPGCQPTRVMPFCPALIAGWGIAWIALRSGAV